MSNWRPSSGPATAEHRAAMLQRARHYFSAQRVLAVDTPALSRHALTDPNIESLAVTTDSEGDSFLHTSPEFCMKRLLADGYPDIYSICRVFRDGESSKRHLPEFTIIEWYRLGFDLASIIDDTTQFIAACLDDEALLGSIEQYDYVDVFQQIAEIDVFEASADELASCCNSDQKLVTDIGAQRQAWLDLILSTIIAPQFGDNKLTVVRHYPAGQAALARLCPDDDRVADRFEVFFGSLELANGYVELTDATEQEQRIRDDLDTRRQTGRRQYPRDENLIAALESGLPECAGVAVGLERLQMVFDKSDDMADVVTFASKT